MCIGGAQTGIMGRIRLSDLNEPQKKAVTTTEGPRARIIAVFSYYEKPGVTFTEEERVGFYGRAG